LPNAKIEGNVGRTTSFEITADGNVIYSKLEKRKFPVFKDVVAACIEIAETGKQKSEIKGEESSCSVL